MPGHREYQYLDLIKRIFREGERRNDRTGVGTRSIFHHVMTYDLSEGFPLFTTKKVNFKAVKEELLWFLSGNTDANTLSRKGVKIWDANGTREVLNARGLYERKQGDLGPVYGFQWRHFGATYKTSGTSYEGQGIDQITELVKSLKNDPMSRRHILTAWNPSDIASMALPPCHMLSQFYVTQTGRLHCHLVQRSADVGLGLPFNVASYALLTHMLAQTCGLIPGTLYHTIGDAHIYETHVDTLAVQITRVPKPFPKLRLNPIIENIFDFTSDDISIEQYDHHPPLPMPMAV